MKINKWSIGFAIALLGLTTYMVLDTFVIPEKYQEDTTQMNTNIVQSLASSEEEEGPYVVTKENESETVIETKETETEENAADELQSVTEPVINVTTYRVNDTNIYVADILLPSVESLKTAFAQDTYGRKITDKTSDMAEDNDAILAINGDYYGARERGYVIRNGILYRDTVSDEDVLCIYSDGHMEIIDPTEVSAQELIEAGVWQAFSFGPGLIENGEYLVDQNDEVGRAMASNPRTAIGMIDNNHYVFVVSDGRTEDNEGLSLYELAEFMDSLGVKTAYNLDGGGSSTMVYEGEIINTPANGRHSSERSVSDIVYIR